MVFRGETGAAIKQATRVLVGAASRGAPYELQDVATAENGDSRVASVLMAGFDSSTRHALEGLSPELKLDACQPCQVEHLLEEHPYSLLLYNAVEKCEHLLVTLSRTSRRMPVVTALHPSLRGFAPKLVESGVSRIFYHPIDPQLIYREVSGILRLSSPRIGLFQRNDRRDPLRKDNQDFVEAARVFVKEVAVAAQCCEESFRTELYRHGAQELVNLLAYHDLTDLAMPAKNLAEILSGSSTPIRNEVLGSCDEIIEFLDIHALPSSVFRGLGPREHAVVISSKDCDLTLEISRLAKQGRMRTLISRPEDLRVSAALMEPDAVIIDLGEMTEEDYESCRQVLLSLACPVIALVDRVDLSRRIELASDGVAIVFDKPVHPAQILERIKSLLSLPAFTRIVAIDDDPIFLVSLESLLLRLESHFTSFATAEGLWEELHFVAPDLIILSLDMGNLDGLGLCRAIRADSRLRQLPIIVTTWSEDPERRQAAYDAGADDVLARDSSRTELRNRIVARLARNKFSRKLLNDELTGLLTRAPAIESIGDILAQSRNRGLSTALAVLDLDYFKKINDRYGHLVGDRVLRDVASNLANEFRSQDVVARWGGEEFLVATFGMTKKDTTRRLALALERLTLEGFLSDEGEEFRVSFSAGVAEFPEDGQSLMELYKAADGALYRAKEEGRCRVIPVNFPRDRFSPTSVDVLLVEHDHPLGCVLVDAIRRVNLSVIWCSTGEEALSRAQTGVSFRLLLVDQDLPGATGLQILQEMLLLKLTEHAQVLMVTSNMSQEQLLQMFDLGVDDHISKPFFLPVIVRHILRVFEERSSCRSR